jgi:hypothetical protein
METWASIVKKGNRLNGDDGVVISNNNILYSIIRWGYLPCDDFGTSFSWCNDSSERDQPEEYIKSIFNHQGYYIFEYKPFNILESANTWAQIQQIIIRNKLKDCTVSIYICKTQNQRNNMLKLNKDKRWY